MAKLSIEIKYGFMLHQNFWTWNGFYLELKFQQRAAVCYTVVVLLVNMWMCMHGNQISLQFRYILYILEDYLFL